MLDDISTLQCYLKVKDYSVSGEVFDLLYDENREMLITHPQPSEKKLPDYYQSQEYISHTDSKRNLFEWLYHLIRSFTLKRKVRLIEKLNPTEQKLLLDVGCGTGDFLKKSKDAGWSVIGVEPDKGARDIASAKNGKVIYKNTQQLKADSQRFDVITLWHVLEHLPNLDEQIKLLRGLLKPNGTLIVAVPNFKCYDAQVYKAKWAAYDAPRHLWHFSRYAMKTVMASHRLSLIKILPMKFDAYYVSMLSEKIKTGRLNFFRALWTGFNSNVRARGNGEYSSLIYLFEHEETGKEAI